MPRRLLCLARAPLAASIALWASDAAALGPSVRAETRALIEYDDNALRLAEPDPEADALTRYFGRAVIEAPGPSTDLNLSIAHGGKVFARVREADTLLTEIRASARRRLGRRAGLGASLHLKDRQERLSLQDYNRGGADLIADLSGARWTIGAQLGWGYFVFKPAPEASAAGPSIALSARALPFERVQLWTSASLLGRAFAVPRARVGPDGELVVDPDEVATRSDRLWIAQLGAAWRGPAIVEASYALSLNRSNSGGQDLTRHDATLSVTAPLGWGVLASARANIQRTSYREGVRLDANFTVDEDNRNNASVALARRLGARLELEARASLYTQEFGAALPYERRIFALGLSYDLATGPD